MSTLKNETTIGSEFNAMLLLAQEHFNNYNQRSYAHHQCLVLSTAEGEHMTYPISSDSVETLKNQECSIVSDLGNSEKNVIDKIVCMWEDSAIDVPPFQFMKKLCEINSENRNAEILLSAGTDTYMTKKISDIIG